MRVGGAATALERRRILRSAFGAAASVVALPVLAACGAGASNKGAKAAGQAAVPAALTGLKSFDNFSESSIDGARWVVATDNQYTVDITKGTLRVYEQTVHGSGGPSAGVASVPGSNKWQVEVDPIALSPGTSAIDDQMGAIYLATDSKRDGPLPAYGFIGTGGGKVALAYLEDTANPVQWNILKPGLAEKTWYTLAAVYTSAGDIDLYFNNQKVATTDPFTYSSGMHLVLRTGGWDGLVTNTIEVHYRNVMWAGSA